MNSQDPQYLPRGTRGDLVESQTGALAPYAPCYADEDDFESDFSLADIFTVLWERKWWILLAALLGLIAALGYSLLQSPKYRATAIIELNPPTVPVLANANESSEEMVVPATDRQFQETQIGILRSRALAERVVQDLSLVKGSEAQGPGSSANGAVPNGSRHCDGPHREALP